MAIATDAEPHGMSRQRGSAVVGKAAITTVASAENPLVDISTSESLSFFMQRGLVVS